MEIWDKVGPTCQEAMQAAAEKPGRYGGRYVGRRYDKANNEDLLVILDDDDPKTVPDEIDVLCHVTPGRVLPVGRMRHFMDDQGNVTFPD